ncbi:N-acetylmannosamine kinase [Vibrio marisflavi]|uniref:N-acetylmannosamine kinase n=1 Tax=Vibrio marisflavi CECT 7928 TaxID=634439 RepID=A0ABM9A2M8_9VIBR|nr:N-acetylmannosamine kinase [Vibrio marisflavi]CAH0538849.1 N-acetylmannosamine kinase [Vibrio marisflavi CECT 7928]
MSTCLALDIGGTKIAVAIVQKGRVEERTQIQTPSSQQPTQLAESLQRLIFSWKDKADYVAVASTGIIDGGELVALNPANLGGLNHFPLRSTIEELSGKPTAVINDAQAAAWAEYQSISQPVSEMAFITVSTGVGGGLIVNGELVIGKHGIAGHIGHTLADPNGPLCGCGRKGCLESIASGRAIAAAGQEHFGDKCTGKTVFEHFEHGDLQAKKIVSLSAQALANTVANLKISFDVQVVVLGGSIGLAPGYLPLVQSFLSKMPDAYQVKLTHALNGADAGLIGVASWAARQLNNDV